MIKVRFGVPLPAAKKGDFCLHAGQVRTGSPDTTTCGQPSARLLDQHDCKTHPPGFPPWPPGPIVKGSSTVFINHLPAARKTDQLLCGVPGPPPPGGANPQTTTYKVRSGDSYHKLMAVEHEMAARDKTKDDKEPDKTELGVADAPAAVAEAKPPPTPSPGSKLVASGPGDNKAFPGQNAPPPPPSPPAQPSGTGPTPTPAEAAGKTKPAQKKKRPSVSVDLAFSMDLSIGIRIGVGASMPNIDVIIPLPETVFIG
jgi:uncharacterized Zn-binding protein involved in type VI secretion